MRIRHQLAIRGVIHGLHADQSGNQGMVVGVDVFHQVQLGLGGADNQNLVRPCRGLCHAVVVVLVFGQSAVTEGSSRRVQLVVRVVGLKWMTWACTWSIQTTAW